MEGIRAALVILAILALWLALKAACVGAALWFNVTYPQGAARMQELYDTRPKRCLVAGLVNIALGVIIALILLNMQVLALLGFFLIGLLISMAVLAYSPAYRVMAERLEMPGGSVFESEVQRIVRSGIATEALFMAPALGQALSIYVLLRGFGALVLMGLTSRRGSAEG